MPTYINKTGSSNKFWSYSVDKSGQVSISWGRVGLKGDSQVKRMSEQELQRKINEKIKGGYSLVDETKLEKEKDLADKIGFRQKVMKMKFVRVNEGTSGFKFEELKNQATGDTILITLLDSWAKQETIVLINPDGTGSEIYESYDRQSNAKVYKKSYINPEIVKALFEYYNDMTEKAKVIIRRAFGSISARDLGETSANFENAVKELKQQSTLDTSEEVIKTFTRRGFANLGGRLLEL